MPIFRDPVSSGSHLLTCLLAIVVTLFLYQLTRGDPKRRACALVFGLCMTVLYAASGLFHALQLPPDDLRVYQKIDMSAIYLMIAGSCTPIMMLLLTGRFRTVLLAGEWIFAAAGIAALWVFPKPVHSVMVGLYLGMGWLGCTGLWHYWRATGWRGVAWAVAGAGFYTLGAIVELANWPVIWPGVVRSHELLHLFDIAGTLCHIVFIVKYVLAYRPSPRASYAQAA